MKATELTVNIITDDSELREAFDEIGSHADRFPVAVEQFFEIEPMRLLRIDSAVVAAGVIVCVVKPSSYLRGFVDALRLCANA